MKEFLLYISKTRSLSQNKEFFSDISTYKNKESSDFGLGSYFFGFDGFIDSGLGKIDIDNLDLINIQNRKIDISNISYTDISYAYVSINIEKEKISIARDYLGLKNVYIYEDDTSVILSNKISIIREVVLKVGGSFGINFQNLSDSLEFKTTLTGKTLINNISDLSLGGMLTISSNFTLKQENNDIINFPENNNCFEENTSIYKEKFDAMIDSIVELSKKGKVGMLFTGGLDSTILLMALKKKTDEIVAITVYQEEYESEDDENSIKFCEDNGIEHVEIGLSSEDVKKLGEVVGYMEDLDILMNGLSLTILKASEYCKNNGLKHLISGSYIEPILGSNPQSLSFLASDDPYRHQIEHYGIGKRELFMNGVDYGYLSETQDTSVFFSKLTKHYRMILNEIFHPYSFSSTFFNKPISDTLQPKENIFPEYLNESKKYSYYDLLTYSDITYRGRYRNNNINQRISNSVGINIIHPFAERDLREFIFGLPVTDKFDPSQYYVTPRDNKVFLKYSLLEYIPKEILFRKKNYGSVPRFHYWLYKGVNYSFFVSKMKQLYDRDIFKKKILLFYINKFIYYNKHQDEFDDTQMVKLSQNIWKFVCLELFYEKFID